MNANGGFTYTPTNGYSGPDSFTYRANDGTVNSNIATVSITVGAAPSGPIAYWTMNEASGTRADTGSAPANDATTVGAPTSVAGQIGNALSLNGTSQHAATPDETSLDITSAITMAAWVRPGAAATQDLISKNVNGATNGYQLSLSDDGAANSQVVFVRFNQTTSGDTYRRQFHDPVPGDRHHVDPRRRHMGRHDRRLYYNGVEQDSLAFAGPIATNTLPLALGAQVTGAGVASRWFDGEMDDVRLYDRALSLAEIQALAQVVNTAPVCSGVPLSTAMNTTRTSPRRARTPTATRSHTRSSGSPRTAPHPSCPGSCATCHDRLHRSGLVHLQGQRRHGGLEHGHGDRDRHDTEQRQRAAVRRDERLRDDGRRARAECDRVHP